MTDKVTLTDVTSFVNDSSAAAEVNANNAAITTAINNTLSRDGTSPNQMGAELDMNGFNIINLPSPATINSPARLADVVSNPTLTIPEVGTSGGTVPLLNGNNTWSGTNDFSTGTLTAATQTSTDNSTKVATTAFVQGKVQPSIVGLSVLGVTGTTTATPVAITGTANQFLGVNSGGTSLAFETMSGDATLSSGAITLATVNTNTGAWGDASTVPTITVNGKGLVTAASSNAVVAPAGTLSGTTLKSTVVSSSLSSTGPDLTLGVDAATPTTSSISAPSVSTGTSDTNGADFVINGSKSTGTGIGGKVIIKTTAAGSTGTTQNTESARITADSAGNVVIGNAALATTATDGFLYIPTCAGAPTGTPAKAATYTGMVPIIFDTTDLKIYVYTGSAWKATVALT